MVTKFSVPDMNCGHCEKSIKEKLKDTTVKVDLKNKLIEVENKKPEEVIQALSEIGCDATVCNKVFLRKKDSKPSLIFKI